ncbi:MAG: EAL domain-containing protein [Betaproteobacteria bacterium]|nr:EAL domain-containing protein [Betaproteobacteria bacterium]
MKLKKNGTNGVEILIVEDSPTQAEKLRALLEEHGYAVAVAPDGKQALAAARGRKPTLIISDVMMPEMDGFELCREIKGDERLKDVPVILLTSLSEVRDIMKGLECGADNFIRKPYEDHYLLARVDHLLMNLELRKSQKMRMGVEIYLGGQRHFITAEQQQIVDLLVSVYEEAVHINEELKLRQRELANSNRSLSGLYHVAEGLNRAVSEREVCEKALEHAMELPGVRAGWISLCEKGNDAFRTAATRNLPPALLGEGAIEGPCECRRRFLVGELDRVTSIVECERLKGAAGDTHGPRYHASVPLWIGDRSLGIMNLVGAEQGLIREDELETLHGVGHQVGIALERARLHEHLEKLVAERTEKLAAVNRVYRVLSGINTTIVRIRDRNELFEEACRIAVEDGSFRMAWVGMFDRGAGRVTPVAVRGEDRGYLESIDLTIEDVPGNCRLLAAALREKRDVVSNDIEHDPAMAYLAPQALERGFRSVIVLPLVVDAEPVGVLALYAGERDFFDAEELPLLREMAGDISFALKHIENEERLNYLAYFDEITGLPNRTLFSDRFAQRLSAARHDRQLCSLIILDLERFRSVNETLGRQAGDELLRLLAQRLKDGLDETDVLARFTGDCFGIVTQRTGAVSLITKALNQILFRVQAQPFSVGGKELRVAAKAGVAVYPGDGEDVETLYRNAEAALRDAKSSGQRYLFYARQMNARAADRLTLENKLRRAVERQEFALHYQPKISLITKRITGVEALIRWADPEAGLVSPGLFVPVLEETGLIIEVGTWVMRQALIDLDAWCSAGAEPVRIAVNVSAFQLRQKSFVDDVRKVVEAREDLAGSLEMEITESLVMEDIEENIPKLKAIRELGATVAVDDFGTGYSSLSYIAKLPISALKIDRAFIMNLADSPDSVSIVQTIISLAHSLRLNVVAEGVETAEQEKLLSLFRCDEAQGFWFGRPVPADRILESLRKPA